MKRKMPSAAVIRANIWKNRYIYLMILPVVAYFAIIHYWAMGWLSISFYDFKLLRGFAGSKFVGLANFEKFISGVNFWPVIKNTLLLNFYTLLFYFPVPVIFARCSMKSNPQSTSAWYRPSTTCLTSCPLLCW